MTLEPGPLELNRETAPGHLRALFDAALEQPTAARSDWIAANAADADQYAVLLRLVAAELATGPLDTPVMDFVARIGGVEETYIDRLAGGSLGGFHLARLIGVGGMGAVFLGEREREGIVERVAIKLPRRPCYLELEQDLVRRESRMMQMLSHPNIARLIDCGVSEHGIPYLVMEYVDGVHVTEYAALHRLGPRARLRLFLMVCRAVDAAHRRRIAHCDVKPANILVDEQGRVKLLDFGIARLLDDGGDGPHADRTVMTPGYAAPEQYSGGPISAATDVYALGIVLHELLLGVRPESGAARGPAARSTAPDLDALPELPGARRGDLDRIMRRALVADPDRRYASAGAFAEDIERHLADPPRRLARSSG